MKLSINGHSIYLLVVLYLIVPFALFVGCWLRTVYAVPVLAIISYSVYQIGVDIYSRPAWPVNLSKGQKRQLLFGFLLLIGWTFFSGIGNLAFQNSDFEVRNAILRDLVQQDWPILYNSTIRPAGQAFESNRFLLIYYFGYWLPAAGVGKLFGLEAANLFLFFWTLFGLGLVYGLLCIYLKKTTWVIVLLLIVWSGLDGLGAALTSALGADTLQYGVLSHIEWWAHGLNVRAQFSSNTTLLYWVFNQTIPLWLSILLLLNSRSQSYLLLVLALSLFLAPIGTVGLLPIVAFQLISGAMKTGLRVAVAAYCTVANLIGGGSVLVVTGLFFTANKAGALRGIVAMDPLAYGLFFLLEVGLLIGMLYYYRRESRPLMLFCALLLLLIPFVRIGRMYDFSMRASIASLFILFVLTARTVVDRSTSQSTKRLFILYLLIGSCTPGLELIRSVFFTGSHYAYEAKQALVASHEERLIPRFVDRRIKERAFLYDPIRTLSTYHPHILIDQFIGESKGTLFADHLLKKRTTEAVISIRAR